MLTAYQLLTTTFYKSVSATTVLSGARAGVVQYVHLHGKTVAIRPPTSADARAPLSYFEKMSASVSRVLPQALERQQAMYEAIKGMASSVHDRWTEYFDPAEYKAFDTALDPPNISGIGVLMQDDAAAKCQSVFFVVPNGPADAAGVVTGDHIQAVNGVPACGLPMSGVSKLLRGVSGTAVNVTLLRDGNTVNVSMKRAAVHTPTVYFKMLPDKIGYVNVLVFGGPTASEFSEALSRLQAQGARGLILDLRDDGGGYVASAASIASHFISNGAIFSTLAKGRTITYESDNESPQFTQPVAVLVNQYTASASEIAASALQDNAVGELIGTRTFGKGVEQEVTRFSDGSAIKITDARYLTAGNHDVNGIGLRPQMVVLENASAQFGEPSNDAQLRAAMAFLEPRLTPG